MSDATSLTWVLVRPPAHPRSGPGPESVRTNPCPRAAVVPAWAQGHCALMPKLPEAGGLVGPCPCVAPWRAASRLHLQGFDISQL